MRNFTLILAASIDACLCVALFIAPPVMAMSTPPSVPASNQPVPVAELNALTAVQACVVRTYDALPTQAAKVRDGVQVDYVSSQTERARQAYQRTNMPVFSEARANVARTVVALGYAC